MHNKITRIVHTVTLTGEEIVRLVNASNLSQKIIPAVFIPLEATVRMVMSLGTYYNIDEDYPIKIMWDETVEE